MQFISERTGRSLLGCTYYRHVLDAACGQSVRVLCKRSIFSCLKRYRKKERERERSRVKEKRDLELYMYRKRKKNVREIDKMSVNVIKTPLLLLVEKIKVRNILPSMYVLLLHN